MRERGGKIDGVMSEEEGSKDGARRGRIWGVPTPSLPHQPSKVVKYDYVDQRRTKKFTLLYICF
jgi:hypothetical protein